MLHFQVTALRLFSSIIPVVDKDGQHWFLVAVGRFESPDAARAASPSISRQLGIGDPLTLILLPPEK